jgi:hypothetical protein
MATTRPASGPAAPMSMSFFRSLVPDCTITAPMVPSSPMRGGRGMKKGSEAGTPWIRAAM